MIKNTSQASPEKCTYQHAVSVVSELRRIGFSVTDLVEYNMVNGINTPVPVGGENWEPDADTHEYTANFNGTVENVGLVGARLGKGGLTVILNELQDEITTQNPVATAAAAYQRLVNLPGVGAALDSLLALNIAS
jgi:hypothetical protein